MCGTYRTDRPQARPLRFMYTPKLCPLATHSETRSTPPLEGPKDKGKELTLRWGPPVPI